MRSSIHNSKPNLIMDVAVYGNYRTTLGLQLIMIANMLTLSYLYVDNVTRGSASQRTRQDLRNPRMSGIHGFVSANF